MRVFLRFVATAAAAWAAASIEARASEWGNILGYCGQNDTQFQQASYNAASAQSNGGGASSDCTYTGCGNCGPANCGCASCSDCNGNCNGGCNRCDRTESFDGLFGDLFGSHWHGPVWAAKAGALIMERANPHPATLYQDAFTLEEVSNTKNFTFNWDGGYDVSILRRLSNCTTLEVRYFAIDGWNSQQTLTPVDDVNIPTFPEITIAGGTALDATYTSRIYNGEVNWRHRIDDRIVWLWGFRALQLHENLDIAADVGGGEITNVIFNTDNHLYGGQLGTDIHLLGDSCFCVDGVLKAGVFGNYADGVSQLVQQGDALLLTADHRTQVAFVGECDLTIAYRWNCHTTIRGGYQVMWVEGAATASDQIGAVDLNTGTGINTVGGVFYQGAMVSLDFCW